MKTDYCSFVVKNSGCFERGVVNLHMTKTSSVSILRTTIESYLAKMISVGSLPHFWFLKKNFMEILSSYFMSLMTILL